MNEQFYFYVNYFFTQGNDETGYNLSVGGNGPATFAHVPPTIDDIKDMQDLILEDIKKKDPSVQAVVISGWNLIQVDDKQEVVQDKVEETNENDDNDEILDVSDMVDISDSDR